MKKIISALMCMILLGGLFITAHAQKAKTVKNINKRLEEYAFAVDYEYETPEKIYDFMTQDFKSKMSKDEFVAAYEKERSYPYLTGLYFYDPVITDVDKDLSSGKATYTQAARLIGMTYSVEFVYENNNYYIKDWDNFLDGSYLDKFEDCPYTLDWYYDSDNCTKYNK